ncbi:hypothetical protein ACH5RR_021161 [Cinchona calisaya]|uniref:Uncharacterized protein n=1 Tax=Cinchona calisaya TaxID=153742 RepID=A0ABD2ZJF9_9GENT
MIGSLGYPIRLSDWIGLQAMGKLFKGVYNGKDELDWWCKNEHQDDLQGIVRKLSLGSSVYFIWMERNRRIFTQKIKPAEVVLKECCDEIRCYVAGWRK